MRGSENLIFDWCGRILKVCTFHVLTEQAPGMSRALPDCPFTDLLTTIKCKRNRVNFVIDDDRCSATLCIRVENRKGKNTNAKWAKCEVIAMRYRWATGMRGACDRTKGDTWSRHSWSVCRAHCSTRLNLTWPYRDARRMSIYFISFSCSAQCAFWERMHWTMSLLRWSLSSDWFFRSHCRMRSSSGSSETRAACCLHLGSFCNRHVKSVIYLQIRIDTGR